MSVLPLQAQSVAEPVYPVRLDQTVLLETQDIQVETRLRSTLLREG